MRASKLWLAWPSVAILKLFGGLDVSIDISMFSMAEVSALQVTRRAEQSKT
jgi:hypothetical protein